MHVFTPDLFLPLDADAVVLVTLCGDHDIGLIQHKHLDLFGVNELQFCAPIQHGSGCADYDLLLQLAAALH